MIQIFLGGHLEGLHLVLPPGITPAMLQGSYGMLKIELRLASCKASSSSKDPNFLRGITHVTECSAKACLLSPGVWFYSSVLPLETYLWEVHTFPRSSLVHSAFTCKYLLSMYCVLNSVQVKHHVCEQKKTIPSLPKFVVMRQFLSSPKDSINPKMSTFWIGLLPLMGPS